MSCNPKYKDRNGFWCWKKSRIRNKDRRQRLLNNQALDICMSYGGQRYLDSLLRAMRYDRSNAVEIKRFDRNEKGELCYPASVIKLAILENIPEDMKTVFRKWTLVQPGQVPILLDMEPVRQTAIRQEHTEYQLNNPFGVVGPFCSEYFRGNQDLMIRFTLYYLAKFIAKDFLQKILLENPTLRVRFYDDVFYWIIKSIEIRERPIREGGYIDKAGFLHNLKLTKW